MIFVEGKDKRLSAFANEEKGPVISRESIILASDLIVSPIVGEIPAPYTLGECRVSDLPSLANLYLQAYRHESPGATFEQAVRDVESCFAGDYGDMWPAASKTIGFADKIIGLIFVVKFNDWESSLACPYIVELLIDEQHRGKGLARHLVGHALQVAKNGHASELALSVAKENIPALNLYRSLGFQEIEAKH